MIQIYQLVLLHPSITVTGVRPAVGAANIVGSFELIITLEDVSEVLTVEVNLTAEVAPILPH